MTYRKKLVSIQALRALAFMGILSMHCGLAKLGTWGVSVFFVLSGFILTFKSLSEGKTYPVSIQGGIRYAKSKIQKLYPTHIITMFAMLILVLYQMYINGILNQWQKQGIYVVLNLLLIQNWFPSFETRCSLNGVAWYLSAMTFVYFLFPIMFCIVGKYKETNAGIWGLGITHVIATAIAFLLFKLERDMYYFTYFFPPYRCLDFFAGCNLGYIFYKSNNKSITVKADNKEHIIRDTLYELAGIAFVCVTIYADWNLAGNTALGWMKHAILYLPSSCGLIYLFALEKGLITRSLSNRVLAGLGNISGYMFLIHYPVFFYFQSLCLKVFGRFVNPIIQTVCVLLITVVLTKLWLWVCERFKQDRCERYKNIM